MIGLWGIEKPAMKAFELLNRLGDLEPQVQVSPPNGASVSPGPIGNETTLSVLASYTQGGNMTMIISNYRCPDCGAVNNQSIDSIKVQGFAGKQAFVTRVDVDHCDVKGAWEAMGSPAFPTPSQIQQLKQIAVLQDEPWSNFRQIDELVEVSNLSIPANGLVALTVVP